MERGGLHPELTIHRKHRLDVVGVGLASAGLFAWIFGLIEGQRYDFGRAAGRGGRRGTSAPTR
jgi:hypothetical protein